MYYKNISLHLAYLSNEKITLHGGRLVVETSDWFKVSEARSGFS